MKQVEIISQGTNFSALSVGSMSTINQYQLPLGEHIIPGKVFIGQPLAATGAEISFQSFAPSTDSGFFHKHINHEELYFILKGKGEYQVDDTTFPIAEGTIVRVAPEGKRILRNTGSEELIMICVQYKGNTFTADDAHDGIIL